MKIFYDGYIYHAQKAGGINRYFTQIIHNLPETYQPTLVCPRDNIDYFPTHPNLNVVTTELFKPIQLSARWMRWKFQREFKTIDYSFVHPTYYEALTWKNINQCRKPIILSVWDFIHEIFPESMDPGGKHCFLKKKAIYAADIIICISENTKHDLFRFYGDSLEGKIFVIPLASSISKEQSYNENPVPVNPYLLYVGSRNVYKGFYKLLHAFSRISSQNTDLKLCVVGGAFTPEEQKQIESLGLSIKVINMGLVDDNYLAKLYRCSLAFVYPSDYEGFGIPPLEAMACGTPVIAANSSSIPEVVGNAALLFEPSTPDDLEDKLSFIIDNPVVRDNLIEAGYKQESLFSWKKTVQKTLEIYQDLT